MQTGYLLLNRNAPCILCGKSVYLYSIILYIDKIFKNVNIKNVTGYNLTQLIVGSEGTLGIVTEATLKLIPKPETKKVMITFFKSIDDATGFFSPKRLHPGTIYILLF